MGHGLGRRERARLASSCGGYAGTYFWIDPQEQIVGICMTQAPGPIRTYYRKLFKQLVYAAIVD